MTIPELFVEFAPDAGPLDVIGETYTTMDGSTLSSPSTPDSTSYTGLTDLDIRIVAEADFSRNMALVGKWAGGGSGATTDLNDRSFVFWTAGGTLAFSWSEDGTNANSYSTFAYSTTANTTFPTPIGTGLRALRVSFDADNGSGGVTSTFYTGESIDGPWTAYGVPFTTTVAGTATIFDSTTELRIGEILNADNAFVFVGKLDQAVIYSGTNANTTLANPNFNEQPAGTTSFTDDIGKVWTLGTGTEIVRFDWVDISDDTIAASWAYGRDDELEHFPAGEGTVILYNDDRKYDPEYSSSTYAGKLLPRVPFRIMSASVGMSNPAFGTGNAGTPDHASYSMSDIDVRVHAAIDDWTPATLGRFFVSQYVGGDVSWAFGLNTDGSPLFIYSTDGTATLAVTASATVAVSDQAPVWLRCAFDSDVGGVSNQTYFYKSDDGVEWTQLGATQTHTGTVSLFNSTAALSVGAVLAPGGYFYEMDLRSGIDSNTSVANPKFFEQAIGATTFVDSEARVWTATSTAPFEFNSHLKLDQFYGFVENGWEQQLYPPEGSNCQVRLVDKMGVLTGYSLPDVMDYAVSLNEPVGYWVLNGPSGTETVVDLASPAHNGSVEGPAIQFGEAPIAPGHPTSARMTTTTSFGSNIFGRVVCNNTPINTNSAGTRSVMATFRVAATSPANYSTIFVENDGLGFGFGQTVINLRVETNGLMVYQFVNPGGGITFTHPTSVVDGTGHFVVGTGSGIYLDSATLTQSTTTGSGIGGQGVGIGGLNGVLDIDHFNGWIGAVALFDRSLRAGEVTTLFDGFQKLNGLRSDEQIRWALDRLGIPPDHMNLSEGNIVMGTAETAGRDMLEWIRDVTSTEGGAFYVDHRDKGKIRFTNRYYRYTQTRSTTTQISFSDDPALSFFDAVRVEREDLDIAPNGIDGITNQVIVTWRGGEVTVSDDTSVAKYGPRSRQLDTQATVASIAISAGEWLLARYANPQFRVKQIAIYPAAAVTAFKAALNLHINDRVTYRSHPQMVGTAIETDLYVDGVTHTVERGVDWKTTYRLAQADAFTPWIWGTGAWDVSTYWG